MSWNGYGYATIVAPPGIEIAAALQFDGIPEDSDRLPLLRCGWVMQSSEFFVDFRDIEL